MVASSCSTCSIRRVTQVYDQNIEIKVNGKEQDYDSVNSSWIICEINTAYDYI